MQTLNIFFFVAFGKILICESSKTDVFVAQAVLETIDSFYSMNSHEINLIYHDKSEDLANKILCRTKMALKISKINQNSVKIQLNTSSILLFDSAKSFHQQNISWQISKTESYHHLVYFPDGKFDDLKNVNVFSIDNVNFLINQTDESIDLVTNFMWREHHQCRVNHFVTINRFMKSTMQWKNMNFFSEKYENFHGCTLTVAVLKNVMQSSVRTFENGSIEVKGYSHDVVKALANYYNFQMKYKVYEDVEAASKASDVDLYGITSMQEYSDKIVTSHSYLFDFYSLFIPPGELYSPFEKMFLMFEFELWMSIVVTLLVAIATIQIVNFTSIKVQKFVFGKETKSPTLSLASIFLTGGNHTTPTRNFARFLVINFTIWSMIIRTCYQSELYKYLQKDIRKLEVQTIQEMVEKGFTFYGDDDFINKTKKKVGKK
jgi:hypothetical protein